MKLIMPLSAVAALSLLGACSQFSRGSEPATVAPVPAVQPADSTAVEPAVAEAEADASAPAPAATGAGQRLGEVTASLGDPSEAGTWLATSLVSSVQPGRVEIASTGQSADVELRPAQGGATLSLSAMQALGLGLADIPTVAVYTR